MYFYYTGFFSPSPLPKFPFLKLENPQTFSCCTIGMCKILCKIRVFSLRKGKYFVGVFFSAPPNTPVFPVEKKWLFLCYRFWVRKLLLEETFYLLNTGGGESLGKPREKKPSWFFLVPYITWPSKVVHECKWCSLRHTCHPVGLNNCRVLRLQSALILWLPPWQLSGFQSSETWSLSTPHTGKCCIGIASRRAHCAACSPGVICALVVVLQNWNGVGTRAAGRSYTMSPYTIKVTRPNIPWNDPTLCIQMWQVLVGPGRWDTMSLW